MRLSAQRLDRTLLVRQHLVDQERRESDPVAVVGRLVGLQAEEDLPPCLALAAR